jgi:hypothetical protein
MPATREQLEKMKGHKEEPETLPEINVAEGEQVNPREGGNRDLDMLVMADYLHREKRVKVVIPSTETQKDPVVVGINGFTYNIPRDKEVSLPMSAFRILEQAVITQYSVKKREGDDEGNEMLSRDVKRFPYQVQI